VEKRRSRLVAGLAAVAAVVGIAGSCGPRVVDRGALQPMLDCPTHSGPHAPMPPGVPTNGANIQEFHDCQRLKEGPNRFGALAGIWAIEDAAPITAADFQRPGGAAVAHVRLFDGNYPQLRLHAGYNCLYLRIQGGSHEGRVVAMQNDGTCAPTLPNWNGPGTVRLQVRADTAQGTSAADYPPVARWHYAAPRHYMGVRCLNAWCTFGVGMPPAHAQGSGGSHRRVPGWFDQQFLAVGQPGSLVPTTVLSTIIPDSLLGSRTIPNHFDCRRAELGPNGCARDNAQSWVPVATAFSDGPIPEYQRKMNLSGDWRQPSWVYLRFDPQAAPADQWQARITVANGATVYYAVERSDLGRRPPPMARWRWDPADERMWIACDAGCCTIREERMN
jgi:hypothetical protein